MTKRLRDGPVMLQAKRPCIQMAAPVVSLKRKRDDVDEFVRQFNPGGLESRGVKRSAEGFDIELQRLEKRMRASVPTAEEAIAFLIPHITQLRQLYNGERGRANTLETKNIVMKRACLHLLQEKKRLEMELYDAKLRLSVSGPRPSNAWPIK